MNNIHIGYFLGGIFCISNAVYGVVTGDLIGIDLQIKKKHVDQTSFYFSLIASFLLGGGLLYRSFLKIGNNKEFHEKSEEYYEDTSVDLINIIKILLIMLVVIALIFILKL